MRRSSVLLCARFAVDVTMQPKRLIIDVRDSQATYASIRGGFDLRLEVFDQLVGAVGLS